MFFRNPKEMMELWAEIAQLIKAAATDSRL